MQSGAHLRLTLWLAFFFLRRLHAFPFPLPFVDPPYTSQQDVDAINDLYAALGSPDLDGWTASGGDPCKEAWQGVQCDGPNIIAIELRGAGLGGKLSETLGYFTAVTRLDLSNNQIGGGIPQSLPPAITELDLSSNDLSGELPDSMAKLNSLSTLHVQSNQLTGTLDVLGDLPLKDLDVENNLFSGPIPEKLLSIPKFLRNGNHFSVPPIPGSSPTPSTPFVPSTSPPPPPPASNHAPAPQEPPALSAGSHPPIYVIPATPQADADADPPRHNNNGKVSPAKAAGFSILAAGSLGVAVVAIVLAVSKRRREGSPPSAGDYLRGGVEMSMPRWVCESATASRTSAVSKPDTENHSEEKKELPPRDYYVTAAGSSFKQSSVVSDTNVQGRPQVQPPQFSFTVFTVASLQQHTNSFSDQNLIRETCFGKVYLAEFQESKFAVLKLDGSAAKMMPVAEFLKIVQGIAELQRHPNVEELVGCCADHGQRLLVYRHFSDSTLGDLIHHPEHGASGHAETLLPWEARVAVALEAAKALEYLHEGSPRQVVHQHFRPEHVLVDGELRVSVSGGGLAPFVPSGVALQLSDYCGGTLSYEPPEAAWTAKGDVYSFGVVMLQLLTGREPYDRSQARGERHLVPWASPRLHDLAALRTMADPRLGHPPPVRSLSRFADIIGRCIQQEAEFRPGMSQVVQDLRRALDDARAGTGSSVVE